MKIETSVPDEVFLEAQRLAKRLNISDGELFRQAVVAFVRSGPAPEPQETDPVREKLDSVYSEQPSEVDEALLRMQFASLPKEAWRYGGEKSTGRCLLNQRVQDQDFEGPWS